METLIGVLIMAVLIALLGYGLYWACTKFFPSFAPALWICGVFMIVVILYAAERFLNGQLKWPLP